MKKILNRVIVVILILATIISIPSMSVNAAVKIEDNLKWFYTNSDYVKSITIPLDYYNYQAEYDYEKDYKKYTKYYVYDNILLPNFNIKATYKVSYNKKIADVKIIKDGNNSFLAIKPLKKGTTDLKISITAKGYHTYNLTTKINIVGAGKTIQIRTGLNNYFVTADKDRQGFGFVTDVIKELKLEEKSLYDKVIYTAKWCIDNKEKLIELYDTDNYLNKLFSEFMKQLNIPCYSNNPNGFIMGTSHNLILMNDDKWYMVNINNASFLSTKYIQDEISSLEEDIKYFQAEWEDEERFFDDDYYKEMINNAEVQLIDMNEKLKQVNAGIPVLTFTLVSPYSDDTYSKKNVLLGKEFATEDLLKDPNNTQKIYTGILPHFTKDKLTINLLNSLHKSIKLPMYLNGIKADDIGISESARDKWNCLPDSAIQGVKVDDKNSKYVYPLVSTKGSFLLEAESSSIITDTLEVEIIAPSLDGKESYAIHNIKKGEKIKAPLVNAEFSNFNIKTENSKIATVSSSGVITAKSKGATKIIFESKTNKNFKLTLWIGVEKSATF